ncbi:MAG: ABC transporter permease [Gammaproteobacteria bacterium]|nr:ABC transporter permease [Gammaproteobacteria bacterium]MCD8542576.1 ABC transporter permease [Gammaproteobacteria bacterium]
MFTSLIKSGLYDIAQALKQYSLIGMLGWHDVSHRYKRSSLGAFWLTISTSVMITTIGVLFSKIFHAPLREFLPYVSIGMIIWGLISTVITEGCQAFISAQPIIKQLNLPLFLHIARLIWKNIVILGHNLMIIPIVFLIVWQPIKISILLSLLGFALLIINLSWLTLLLSIFCARYRDTPPIVSSILQILFYLTPIMWMPERLGARANLYLLQSNPFYHWLNVVREPLLSHHASWFSWEFSFATAFLGWLMTLFVFTRYRCRIAYWL